MMQLILSITTLVVSGAAFQAAPPSSFRGLRSSRKATLSVSSADEQEDLSSIVTERFPTSIDDQVRQASESLRRANQDGYHRHSIRLLLPIIGATDLDDWPGGTRQMAEAANPLMQFVLKNLGAKDLSVSVIDESDGVGAIMAQAEDPKQDSCAVLLPSADTVKKLLALDEEVGPQRDLTLVNTQWKRQTDFGFFRRGDQVSYVESFIPSFFCSNLMVEGEQARILRSYPGPWRVFLRLENEEDGTMEWQQIGDKNIVSIKPAGYDKDPANTRDGGKLFDYGQPTYQEIETMIVTREGFMPKSMAERAAAAFTFIKDTL